MTNSEKQPSTVSLSTLRRLPYYVRYLKSLDQESGGSISAPAIARELRLNEVSVRKDLAAISTRHGKPKTGFDVTELIDDLEEYLGYKNVNEAVLVGAGQLGKALLSYRGFDNYGLRIVVAFDRDASVVGSEIGGKLVLPVSKMQGLCEWMGIHIGIITVPAEGAQQVCDEMVAGGILAIWNFAPVHLTVPGHILVQDENMAASLAVLSKHLMEKIKKG